MPDKRCNSEGGQVSNKLRQVIVPFLSPKECEREYKGEIDETMVCAGRKGVDSCQVDWRSLAFVELFFFLVAYRKEGEHNAESWISG